jgi:hypothetical protein
MKGEVNWLAYTLSFKNLRKLLIWNYEYLNLKNESISDICVLSTCE